MGWDEYKSMRCLITVLYDQMTGEFSYYVNYPAPDDTIAEKR